MTDEQLMHAHFYQSYGPIDIWRTQDTKAGKTVYQFWFQGKAYERDTEKEIKDLARNLYNDWFKKANGKERGAK